MSTARKYALIREFKHHVARLNQNTDYDTKVLHEKFAYLAQNLTDEQLANIVAKQCSQQ